MVAGEFLGEVNTFHRLLVRVLDTARHICCQCPVTVLLWFVFRTSGRLFEVGKPNELIAGLLFATNLVASIGRLKGCNQSGNSRSLLRP